MRKIHVLALALLAMFAFGAVTATSAFAEEEEPLFLISGAEVVAGQLLDSEGELLLADHKGGIFGEELMVLCSGQNLAEVVNPNEISITAVYALGAADPEGAGKISCTTQAGVCSSPVATPVNLPWLVELALEGTTVGLLLPGSGTNNPGWTVECNSIVEDTCTGQETMEVKNEANGTVDSFFNEQTGACTRGGAGAALVEGLVAFLSVEAGLSLEVVLGPLAKLDRLGTGVISVKLGAGEKSEETIKYVAPTLNVSLSSGEMRVSVTPESEFTVVPPAMNTCNGKTITNTQTCLVAIACTTAAVDTHQGTVVVSSRMPFVHDTEWIVECKA